MNFDVSTSNFSEKLVTKIWSLIKFKNSKKKNRF